MKATSVNIDLKPYILSERIFKNWVKEENHVSMHTAWFYLYKAKEKGKTKQ